MEDNRELETKLRQYPSNFNLYDEVQTMSKDCIEKHKERLVKEIESREYDNNMEMFRAWNFISFLSFILGNEKDAFEYNSKVLEKSKGNIIGLCNKAWFLLKRQEQYSAVRYLCEQLNDCIKNKVDFWFAKAEKAFCYLCFGMKYNKKSRQFFEEVLCEIDQQIGHNTDENVLMQADHYCVLNFGYSLTLKRSLNFNKTHDSSSFDLSTQAEMIKEVCNIYSRIIYMEGNSKCLQTYQGRSYVELGALSYSIRKYNSIFPRGIKDVLPNRKGLWLDTTKFLVRAESLCPNDVFVLERCGQYFRYVNNINKSISLLTKALQIRETSFSHHHLALSLKRQLEIEGRKGNDVIAKANHYETKEYQSISRNFHRKSEEVKSPFRSTMSDHYLIPKRTSDNTHKQRNNLETRSDNTNLQVPTMLDDFLPPERMQRYGLEIANEDESGIDQVCEKLNHTSLDSGYKTLSLDLNASIQDHDTETQMIFEGEKVSVRVDRNVSFKSEAIGKCQNKNQHDLEGGGFYRNSSSVKPNVSESGFEENDRNNLHFNLKAKEKKKLSTHQKEKRIDSEGRTPLIDRKAVFNMIKSPQTPVLIYNIKNKNTIKQIIFHFDKSFELSNNCGAIYDKGILYRQIKEHENALETFKTLIRNEGGHCSLVQISNAYEQSGLCLYDILSQSEEENKNKENDMRMYFKRSIEISCAIVSKIPFLKDCWVSAPTLREFLSGKAKTTEYLKDLVFLSKKFENYGEAISVLKDLKEITKDEKEKTKFDLQLVDNYLRIGNYDDAVLALDTIVCLQNGYEIINEKLYLQAHIEGGIVALKQGSIDMARLRLRNALDFCRHNQNAEEIEDDTDTEEEKFDIFILCNEEIEEKSLSLEHVLTSFKLRVSINLRHLLPGTSKMAGIYQLFQRSKHFLLIVDETPLCRITEYHFELMHEVVLKRNFGHIVIVKTSRDAKTPLQFSKFPNMDMNFEADEVSDFGAFYENESLCEKVKELLIKVASSKKST